MNTDKKTLDYIKKYIKNHPDKNTVNDLIEYIQSEAKQIDEENLLRKKKEEEWYADCTGKYYMINFNGYSYQFIYIDHPIDPYNKQFGSNKFPTYSIYKSDCRFIVEKLEDDELNVAWLGNPFSVHWMGYKGEDVTEITDMQFQSVVDLYNRHKQEINDLICF